MILSCQDLSKSFGTDSIIKQASFHIEDREKTALIGVNGAGKTTILRMIAGDLEPDTGTVSLAKGMTVGYLKQHQDVNSTASVYSELMDVKKDLLQMENKMRQMEEDMKRLEGVPLQNLMEEYNRVSTAFENGEGYAVHSEVVGILNGLGFSEDDFEKPVCTLSGGQKTRVALARLLLSQPDLLLLDEPTNHLDLKSVSWLETYLLNYNKAMLIVSHDRYFLNRIVTKVFELEDGTVRSFSGNYSDYAKKKSELRKTEWKAYLNQQQEIRRQEAVISKLKSFNREKSVRRAQSREKALQKMETLEKPADEKTDMHLKFKPSVLSGKDVLTVKDLTKSYPENLLFEKINFMIRRSEKVALIGDNGTGKTTILKILIGLEKADEGQAILGSRVYVGYYDQEHQSLHPEKTLFDEIADSYPDLTDTQIRSTLAAFLFSGEDVYKQVKELSGGERGRLSFAKLMLSGANFLILDEPTNHLDITSKEILEEALLNYEGTVLFVSHDRYFINQCASRILELKDHSLNNYLGNYDYYLEKTEEAASLNEQSDSRAAEKSKISETKKDRERKKREQAEKRRIGNELKKTEEQIEKLEERDRELDELLVQKSEAGDLEECRKLGEEKSNLTEDLEMLYGRWEELGELDTKS